MLSYVMKVGKNESENISVSPRLLPPPDTSDREKYYLHFLKNIGLVFVHYICYEVSIQSHDYLVQSTIIGGVVLPPVPWVVRRQYPDILVSIHP